MKSKLKPRGGFMGSVSSQWHRVDECLLAVLTRSQLNVVSVLLSILRQKNLSPETGIRAPDSLLMKRTGFSERQLQRVFNELRKKKYVSTVNQGIPPKRHVLIKIDQLRKDYEQVIQKTCTGGPYSRQNGGFNTKTVKPYGFTVLFTTNSKAGVMFNLESVQAKPDKITDFDVRMASTITGHARKLGLASLSTSKIKNGDSFRILRKTVAEIEIEAVVNWYCSHKTKQELEGAKLPLVSNSLQFRKLFDTWIYPKYQKTRNDVQPSAPALEIVDSLLQLRWEKVSRQSLEQAVEESLRNYTAFLHDLDLVCRQDERMPGAKPGTYKMDGLVTYARSLRMQFENPKSFILKWFTAVREKTLKWDLWKGHCNMYTIKGSEHEEIFKIINKHMVGRGAQWIELQQRIQLLKGL